MAALTPQPSQPLDIGLKNVNVYLIGLMGVGKTTTGKLLAEQLGYQFFDTDALIEQVAGCSISEIFAESGEIQFRDLETQVLAELAAYPRLVVATGGGMVLKPMNWSYLHHGIVVWLNVDLGQLAIRLAGDHSRPLLAADTSPTGEFSQAQLEKLQTLWAERKHLYQQADLEIAVAQTQTADQVVEQIVVKIPQILQQDLS